MQVNVNSLVKSYGDKTVLDGINLSLQNPGVYLIAGPNGSGKTTLLEILVGLRHYNDGQVTINDSRVDHINIRNYVGFLTQSNTLRKNCTVAEELNLIKDLFKLDIDTYDYLKEFKLQEYYHQKTKMLSGGTKRRVLIAMLFMPKYRIVVLDEPVSGLDTFSRDEIWNMIRDYSQDNIVIVSDHYLNQAAQYSDYVYLLNKGKVVLHGNTNELIEDFERGFVIKTRKHYLQELKQYINEGNSQLDLKVSGSVYNFFIKKEDYDTFHSVNSSAKFNMHPVNLEDIYFYHTGELMKETE
ncbi:ABC transporter ATP-binding protein [Bacillus sp. UMB0899]|uniref:ABC transporter ATP-binding protein n=1 Tax=Metabacillus schmidteae TaxID=2730405 RepID=UPI000C80A0CB|nr:ABC transporter ATP-binding protein [Metabacillus schmidteae]PMC35474.1 ABC transporter ATP-binding protein [Bacillus sp. UMB0899]